MCRTPLRKYSSGRDGMRPTLPSDSTPMPGAQVRWRLSDEHFEVLGHGLLWFDDQGLIIGAADVASAASLTELRRAIVRYRVTMYDEEVRLTVYDVEEHLLLEDEDVLSPRDVSLELTHNHTFINLVLAVEADVRFNKYEIAAILRPQLLRHRATLIELTEEILPLVNMARMTVEISHRGRTVGDALAIGDDLLALWRASLGGELTPATAADLIRAQRPELLVGQRETVWFEAKGGSYDLKDERRAIEFAKDVSALANRAEGGLLVLGLTTSKRGGSDTVKAVRPLSLTDARPARHQQAIDTWVFPPPQDLVIESVEIGPDCAVMFILVPPQPDALMPFLVTGAIREDQLLGSHFSLVRRRGDETAITQAETVHGLMVAGRAALALAADHRRRAAGAASDLGQ